MLVDQVREVVPVVRRCNLAPANAQTRFEILTDSVDRGLRREAAPLEFFRSPRRNRQPRRLLLVLPLNRREELPLVRLKPLEIQRSSRARLKRTSFHPRLASRAQVLSPYRLLQEPVLWSHFQQLCVP